MAMDEDYEKWERACRKIRKENEKLLDGFSDWLQGKGLGGKTVGKHVGNVDFYINHYLLYYGATPAKDGAVHAGGFFGEWFIRKAMWASERSIKQTAAGLKKFYRYMYEAGLVEDLDLLYLQDTLKEGMPDWLAAVRRYNEESH